MAETISRGLVRSSGLRKLSCERSRSIVKHQKDSVSEIAVQRGMSFALAMIADHCSESDFGSMTQAEAIADLQTFMTSNSELMQSGKIGDDDDADIAAIEEENDILATSARSTGSKLQREEFPLSFDDAMVEIAPGDSVPLIGAKATWEAIVNADIAVTKCTCCNDDMICVKSADEVICGDCFALNPVLVDANSEKPKKKAEKVCIGIKLTDLRSWSEGDKLLH